MHPEPPHSERGVALILALLALLLLTGIALQMAAMTSIEMQSSINYRWSLKARYNAEAGIAVGQSVLSELSWTYALPPARGPWSSGDDREEWHPEQTAPDLVADDVANRDFEMSACDRRGNGMGYGSVLFDGETRYQDVNEVSDCLLDGAFTLWVRRPVVYGTDGTLQDYPHDDVLILVSAAVAPVGSPSLPGSQATAVVEVTLYSTAHGVTIGPPYRSWAWRDVIATTTPYLVGTSVCR